MPTEREIRNLCRRAADATNSLELQSLIRQLRELLAAYEAQAAKKGIHLVVLTGGIANERFGTSD